MNYSETVEYLYNCVPMFQNIGAQGYKEGLSNTLTLDKHFDHPHRNYRTIHVGGTNGKGSCSHTIAAILQNAGYKVGLYTSPHLIDFRERIRVNGKMVGEDYVVRFVEEHRSFFEPLQPSFFELTTAMAFKYFEQQQVDIAIIEVGLGGRLDCTNIITPTLSVITNISFDHTQFLGHTLPSIAAEKAGIIKSGIPVVIGESNDETKPVFLAKAEEVNATIIFAQENAEVLKTEYDFENAAVLYCTKNFGEIQGELTGLCQEKNANTILHAVTQLRQANLHIDDDDVRRGFANVCELTGLMGRWQLLRDNPRTVCDTGHNEGGFRYIVRQLEQQPCATLRIVFGMVNDKDVSAVLAMLPKQAIYYFAKATVHRALDENDLQQAAAQYGIEGRTFPSIAAAYEAAISEAGTDDFIFIGGSSYVVADLISYLHASNIYK